MHNRGLILKPLDPEDYVFGSETQLTGQVLQPKGQWDKFLPKAERQYRDSLETNACTSFGTLNMLEILTLRKFGKSLNFSDRFLAKLSDTDPLKGNYPKAPAETLRKKWSVYEHEWAFDETIKTVEDFYAEVPKQLRNLALGRGLEYYLKYDFITNTSPLNLMSALMFSPVCISVALMPGDDGMYYKPDGWQDSHWTTLIGYKENEYWLVYDSYPSHFEDSHVKKVKWNTTFSIAMRYELTRNVVNETPWQKFITWFEIYVFGKDNTMA